MAPRDQLTRVFVRHLMSTDAVTVRLESDLARAVGELLDAGVGSIVVVDGEGNSLGIVTETDIVWHLSDLRQEAASPNDPPAEWSPGG